MENNSGIEKQDIRIRGLSAFLLWSIPLTLACGVGAWLGVVSGIISFDHQQALAKRMEARVGVQEPLRTPVKLNIKSDPCLHIEKAFLDGSALTLYIHRTCTGQYGSEYAEWGWKAKSPSGVVLNSKWANTAQFPKGETQEVTMTVGADERADAVEVWAKGNL